MYRAIAASVLLCVSSLASAQWQIDNDSSTVNFISIKKDLVAETHSFGSLAGHIGDDGAVELAIDLDSVEPLIPIRNERMRELLFETRQYPTASVSAQVDPAMIASALAGDVLATTVQVGLSLHGQDALVEVPVQVSAQAGAFISVVSTRPVIINAANFGLDGGIVALREIAGLNAIASAVPVTLNLRFVPDGR